VGAAVDIRISGQASKLKLSPRAYTHLGKLPLLAVFDRPLTGWGSFVKSAMDRSLAAVLIVLLSPVLLFTALRSASTARDRSCSSSAAMAQQ
jgi:lipopolysaccharide/colanic/teichoic acid biosynthesis glycosyltransferase